MKIGFIGCGNMGSAMIGGILKNGVFEKNEIIVSNLTEEGSRRSREKLGVVTTLDNCEVVKNANIVILAVKPQFYEEVIGEIKSFLTPQHMIVGIAPGKTLAWLEEKCEQPLKVVRLMPNTPAQIGRGASAIAAAPDVDEAELKLAEKIFGAVGIVMLVDEHNLDAVTALSGSGPAYVFEFIQALADGGVASGLPRAAATELAVQTVIGAAEMVRATGLHPTALKDQVTSPGGTTIRALEVLEDRAFAGTVIQAVRAACARSEELGRS